MPENKFECDYKRKFILFQATAGGGGRGMRLANEPGEFVKLLQVIRSSSLDMFEFVKDFNAKIQCFCKSCSKHGVKQVPPLEMMEFILRSTSKIQDT